MKTVTIPETQVQSAMTIPVTVSGIDATRTGRRGKRSRARRPRTATHQRAIPTPGRTRATRIQTKPASTTPTVPATRIQTVTTATTARIGLRKTPMVRACRHTTTTTQLLATTNGRRLLSMTPAPGRAAHQSPPRRPTPTRTVPIRTTIRQQPPPTSFRRAVIWPLCRSKTSPNPMTPGATARRISNRTRSIRAIPRTTEPNDRRSRQPQPDSVGCRQLTGQFEDRCSPRWQTGRSHRIHRRPRSS